MINWFKELFGFYLEDIIVYILFLIVAILVGLIIYTAGGPRQIIVDFGKEILSIINEIKG